IDDENSRMIEGTSEESGGCMALVVADVADRGLEAVRGEISGTVHAPQVAVLPAIQLARPLEKRMLVPDDFLRLAPPPRCRNQIRMQMGIVLHAAVALGMRSEQDFAALHHTQRRVMLVR